MNIYRRVDYILISNILILIFIIYLYIYDIDFVPIKENVQLFIVLLDKLSLIFQKYNLGTERSGKGNKK